MRHYLLKLSSAACLPFLLLGLECTRGVWLCSSAHARQEPASRPAEYDRSKLPDSFKYYGPKGLWYQWTEGQKLGRNTWFFYTGGNQKFYRILSRFGGAGGVSIDFFRLFASTPEVRFREIGLVNEPNFQGKEVDEYGFIVDHWKGDPLPGAYPTDPQLYGMPTGVIGLRKFPNPAFSPAMAAEWKANRTEAVKRYFSNPGKVEPPYVVGITCALCHVAFDPLNPPADPIKPRWENLAANMGNQYFREGDLFFGAGRVVAGNANPGKNYPEDPYDSRGLDPSSFIYQYGHTQQPGTSETSRFSYDFINNPNTINQIFNLGGRAGFCETTPTGLKQITNHVLKDGSDSIGIHAALLRVYINIGSEGDYWADRLWNPATGSTQKPFEISEVRMAAGLVEPKTPAEAARKAELLKLYPDLGNAWMESERRIPFLASYLAAYTPYELGSIKNQDGSFKYITNDPAVLDRGKLVFADKCATCHSNKQPFYPLASQEDKTRFFRGLVGSDQFLPGNTLSDDVRYPVDYPGFGINAARALATNAIDGDIWARFSSMDYKALPPLGYITFQNPLGPNGALMTTEFVAPGGGRGYYRTAALNSMWATAPYLHNNSVGNPPLDADGKVDPKVITIEGRLALFEDGVDQLLNPQKRRPYIKLTTADSSLVKGMPGVERMVVGLLETAAKEAVVDVFKDVEAEFAKALDPPAAVKAKIGEVFSSVKARFEPEVKKLESLEDIAKSKLELLAKLKNQVETAVKEKVDQNPALAGSLANIHAKLEAGISSKIDDLGEVALNQFTIPKGFPLNLILNIHISKAPYALAAFVKFKKDPTKLAQALLDLSDCPDLLENRGHTFGAELQDADKKALTEYLKTL